MKRLNVNLVLHNNMSMNTRFEKKILNWHFVRYSLCVCNYKFEAGTTYIIYIQQ